MATAVSLGYIQFISKGVAKAQWTITATGFGTPIAFPNLPDKTFHFLPTTAGTTNVVLEGSNFGPTGPYHTLKTAQGVAMSFATAALETVGENPFYIRPRASTVTAAFNVEIVGHKG